MGAAPSGRGLEVPRCANAALRRILVALLVLAGAFAGGLGLAGAQTGAAAPNVLVIMTDDQTLESMRVMPEVRSLLADQGTTFSNFFVNFSLCCPSRSTYLTGQYAHNHGVTTGSGFELLDSSNTLPVWLEAAGYRTGHVGKYLNGYGFRDPTLIPAGWDEWYAALPNEQKVYDYALNENGTVVPYGTSPADFKGDVLTGKALDFIARNAPSDQPFYLHLAYTAPHQVAPGDTGRCSTSAMPAPQDMGAFQTEPLPGTPNYDEADVNDKPETLRALAPIGAAGTPGVQERYQCQLESLLHVDRGVAELVDELQGLGELDNTDIVFTSDNGQFNGEHRIRAGKLWGYDESIRVPLVVRGPGFPAGSTVDALTTNADLAPTITDAAGVQPGLREDGVSLLHTISNPDPDRAALIEMPIEDQNNHQAFDGIRTRRYFYAEYTDGERELYDLSTDPYEDQGVQDERSYAAVRQWLARRLEELRTCHGAACWRSVGQPPEPTGELGTIPDPGPSPDAGYIPDAHQCSGTAPGVCPLAGGPPFKLPSSVAVSPSGDGVYVADAAANRIYHLAADGTEIGSWGARGSGQGQLIDPEGVAVGPQGDVYVADTANDRVEQFSAAGDFVRTWGTRGSGDGELSAPAGIAVSAAGDVYVADTANDRIEQFSAAGDFVGSWNSGLSSPGAIAVAPSGDVYVADSGNDRIVHFAADGALVGEWGTTGVGPGEFAYPRGVTVAADGDVYVADTATDRIQRFSADGAFVREFGGHGTDFDRFQSPRGVTVTPGGELLVADAINHRVQRFAADGTFVAAWGPGRTDGTFRAPAGVAVGPQGDVYVADSFNDRVQRLSADGSFIGRWGSSGSARGLFSDPEGIATSTAGDVYVIDRSSVQKFHADGAVPLRRWGRPGSGPSQFDNPHGIAITPDGDVYVADTGNGRVQWFDASGADLGSLKLVPGPLDLAVGPTGDVYALNHSSVTVIRDGAIATSWGTSGTEPGLFSNPRGLAVAPNGDVFVVDPGSDAVDQFTAEGEYLATAHSSLLADAGAAASTSTPGRILVATPAGLLSIFMESTRPSPPRLSQTVPGSPSPSASPVIKGSAEAGTQVRLFLTDDCSGGPASVGDAEALASTGIEVDGPANQESEVRAVAVTPAGEESVCSAPIAYISDSIPPTSTIDSGPAPGSTIPGPDATLGFSSPDADVHVFRCKLDVGTYDDCTSPTQLTGLADGAHTLRVRAIDEAGNVDAAPPSRTFYVYGGPADTAAPTATIDSGPSGSVTTGAVTFEFSSADADVRTLQCRLRGTPFAACQSPQHYASLADGRYVFNVRAIDRAGNVQRPPASRAFTVDLTPPTSTIDSGPAQGTTIDSRDTTFGFSSPAPDLRRFDCRVDSGAFRSCSSPVELTGLTDGPHTFRVRAVDTAGNLQVGTATRAFAVDAAPATTIDSGPADGETVPGPDVSFSFSSAAADVSGFECDLDGAGYAPCSSPTDLTGLADGPHAFAVRAIDAAGNVEAAPPSRNFAVGSSLAGGLAPGATLRPLAGTAIPDA